jgi:YVTN family beta-propeller protein
VVDASTLATSYVTGLMTTVASIGVAPNGSILAVGIEARNEIRFEPKLDGTFARMQAALVPAGGAPGAAIFDLNPHLTYTSPSIPELERLQSIGDPRGVAWLPDGSAAFVAALGSDCVVAVNPAGARIARIEVGEGPSGVVAAPIFRASMRDGKFHGVMAATTPTGSRVTRMRRPGHGDGTTSP